jgi:hypothetical protein
MNNPHLGSAPVSGAGDRVRAVANFVINPVFIQQVRLVPRHLSLLPVFAFELFRFPSSTSQQLNISTSYFSVSAFTRLAPCRQSDMI